MPALLINVKIDAQEKFEFFKVTLADLSGLFEECHIKIRGAYASECVKYAQDQLGNGVHLYQGLQEKDWVAATLEMLNRVESRSVFLYFEDHKLVTSKLRLGETLAAFDQCNLDYLCYSFFRASQLDVKNLLPLGAIQHELFSEFYLSASNVDLIGSISPHYYTFSLLSVVSVDYLRVILTAENRKLKIYSTTLLAVLKRLPLSFHHPREVVHAVNTKLSPLGAVLCLYEVSSPFNLEKLWYESITANRRWAFGIPTRELFANFDDDNGVYEESLIKRGHYPFDPHNFTPARGGNLGSVVRQMTLDVGEVFDCTYYSHVGRIRHAPTVQIKVIQGSIAVHYRDDSFSLGPGETKSFYSNLSPVVHCIKRTDLEIRVFDEVFR